MDIGSRQNIRIVFPFVEKLKGLSASMINRFEASGFFSKEQDRNDQYWDYGDDTPATYFREGFLTEYDPYSLAQRKYQIKTVMGVQLEHPVPQPPLRIVIVPRLAVTNEGIGVYFGQVRCLATLQQPQRSLFTKRNIYGSYLQTVLSRSHADLTKKLLPFYTYYTAEPDGRLCLNSNEPEIMQNAYALTMNELERWLQDRIEDDYFSSTTTVKDLLKINKPENLFNVLYSHFGTFFLETWARNVNTEVIKILENFNMGYASSFVHPALPDPQKILGIYADHIAAHPKSKKIYWSTPKAAAREQQEAQPRSARQSGRGIDAARIEQLAGFAQAIARPIRPEIPVFEVFVPNFGRDFLAGVPIPPVAAHIEAAIESEESEGVTTAEEEHWREEVLNEPPTDDGSV